MCEIDSRFTPHHRFVKICSKQHQNKKQEPLNFPFFAPVLWKERVASRIVPGSLLKMIALPDPVSNAIDSAIQAVYSLQPYADPTVVLGTSSARTSLRNLGRNAEFASLCIHPRSAQILYIFLEQF